MGELPALLRILATESREGRLQPAQVAQIKSQLLSDNPALVSKARALLMPRQGRLSISESIPPPPPPRSSVSEMVPPDVDERWGRGGSFDHADGFAVGPPPDFDPGTSDEDDEVLAPPSRAGLARLQIHDDDVEESKFETYERSEIRDQRRRTIQQDNDSSHPPISPPLTSIKKLENSPTSPLQAAKQMVGVVPPPKSRRCDFVLIQDPEKNKFRMRWAEVDPDIMTFSYWKSRAARGKLPPIAAFRLGDIASLEWNTKDVTRGRRASLLGIGGVRFTINMRNGARTMCKAQNPLDARAWLNCIQELITPLLEDNSRGGPKSPHTPTPDEVCLYKAVGTAEKQSGFLQKAEANGANYKDRWCTLDTVTKILSYWAKQPKNESVEKPEGTVNIADVFTFEWNSRDLAQGRRRSFIKMDGVRFDINFKIVNKEQEHWRANNPYEAYRWKDILEKLHNELNASGANNGTMTRIRSGSTPAARTTPSVIPPPPIPSASSAAFIPPPPPISALEAIQSPSGRASSSGPPNVVPRRPSTDVFVPRGSQTLPHLPRETFIQQPAASSFTLPRTSVSESVNSRNSAAPIRAAPTSPAPRRNSNPAVQTNLIPNEKLIAPARVAPPPSPPAPTAHKGVEMSGPVPRESLEGKLPPRNSQTFAPPPPPLSAYPSSPTRPPPTKPGTLKQRI